MMPACHIVPSTIIHTRHGAPSHVLRRRGLSLWVDLDRLDEAGRQARLFSVDRFNLLSLYQRDYGPNFRRRGGAGARGSGEDGIGAMGAVKEGAGARGVGTDGTGENGAGTDGIGENGAGEGVAPGRTGPGRGVVPGTARRTMTARWGLATMQGGLPGGYARTRRSPRCIF